MQENKPTFHILTPVHNRKETTLNFVNCLLGQDYKNFIFYLIDDGSTDGTSEKVKELLPSTNVIKGNGDWWWGGSLQKGYEAVINSEYKENDYVLLINDDVLFGPNYLSVADKLLRQNSNTVICSQYFDQTNGKLLDIGAKCNFETFVITAAQNDSELCFLSTRGLFLKIDDFIKSGGFFPELLPHYLSDYEFTFRLNKMLKLKLMTSGDIPVFGKNDQSGTSDISNLSFFKAINTIFSKRYHRNPFYVSNFIKLCFPKEYQRKFIISLWLDAIKKILSTMPVTVKIPIAAIGMPLRGLVGGIRHFIRYFKESIFRQESVKIRPSVTFKNHFHEFISFSSLNEYEHFISRISDLTVCEVNSNNDSKDEVLEFYDSLLNYYGTNNLQHDVIGFTSISNSMIGDFLVSAVAENKEKRHVLVINGVYFTEDETFWACNTRIATSPVEIANFYKFKEEVLKQGFELKKCHLIEQNVIKGKKILKAFCFFERLGRQTGIEKSKSL